MSEKWDLKTAAGLASSRARIGIITGSGPEAGVDLWRKILEANRRLLGASYRGDLDAPEVTIRSVPCLGLSMQLKKFRAPVREALLLAARNLDQSADYISIACNTLHVFERDIRSLPLRARFVSVVDVAADYVRLSAHHRFALLGSSHTLRGGRTGIYGPLFRSAAVTLPTDRSALDRLILDIKMAGRATTALRSRFRTILERLDVPAVLLACTDLPLLLPIRPRITECVDITSLLATRLAALSLYNPAPALSPDKIRTT